MQSLDYKLKTSNTNNETARHDVQYFPSSLSSFSPATSRVCRIPLTSGTSFIDPESIKIAFRVRNTDATNPLAPATPNPACFIQRIPVFANGRRARSNEALLQARAVPPRAVPRCVPRARAVPRALTVALAQPWALPWALPWAWGLPWA